MEEYPLSRHYTYLNIWLDMSCVIATDIPYIELSLVHQDSFDHFPYRAPSWPLDFPHNVNEVSWGSWPHHTSTAILQLHKACPDVSSSPHLPSLPTPSVFRRRLCFSWKLILSVEIIGGYGFLGSWEREVEDQIKLFANHSRGISL